MNKKILVIGAASCHLIEEAYKWLKNKFAQSKISLLCPKGLDVSCFKGVHFFRSLESFLSEAEIRAAGHHDIAILVLSHPTRKSYKVLLRSMLEICDEGLYFSSNGKAQKVDEHDLYNDFPQRLCIKSQKEEVTNESKKIILFRPSDQTLMNKYREWENEGFNVQVVETLAAFSDLLTRRSKVIFNCCLTDYSILSKAVALSFQVGCSVNAYITVDPVDLCEDRSLSEEFLEFNRSWLPHCEKVYIMKTRPYFIERYFLNKKQIELWTTTGHRGESRRTRRKGTKEIRLLYHGLNYYWHEFPQFLPVFEMLRKKYPVRLDIFGRIHESLEIGNVKLFPKGEESVTKTLGRFQSFSEVKVHGFATRRVLDQCLDETHYYIGLTAIDSLMADSEFRTGIVEVSNRDLTILHKVNSALCDMQLKAGEDFLNIDSKQPKLAAELIWDHFEKNHLKSDK